MMEKRFMVELCLKASRKRLSPQTGFVHLNYDSDELAFHTIPLYENFCYVLGLFRSRLSEDIAEGKALLERLLSFENEGNFPVYLHEFPQCRNRGLSLDLLPIFIHIERQFSSVLGEMLKDKLAKSLARLHKYLEEESIRFPFHNSQGTVGLAKQLIRLQLEGCMEDLSDHWHRGLAIYIGPQGRELFYGPYPAPTLYDLFMAQWSGLFPDRLKNDHPIHIQASLVMPFEEPFPERQHEIPYIADSTIYWGNAHKPYSLTVDPKKTTCSFEEGNFTFKLPEQVPGEGEAEFGFFLNLDPDHRLTIEGEKATTFRLGETVEIATNGLRSVTLSFVLETGEGDFYGHISRANRPRQAAARGERRYETYDYYLSLRTVARSSLCSVGVRVGLSEASPMACSPLST
jgi:hypothetical protein